MFIRKVGLYLDADLNTVCFRNDDPTKTWTEEFPLEHQNRIYEWWQEGYLTNQEIKAGLNILTLMKKLRRKKQKERSQNGHI